ncbi:TlpA family protein disulfide reductase [Streptococcus gallolyticus]|nr:TlpA family protein disulfide reductase [Streptococcus gallolyticus]MBY5040340.1 TlpA family protein disulfide reductase [Streptococcus gallolyticus]
MKIKYWILTLLAGLALVGGVYFLVKDSGPSTTSTTTSSSNKNDGVQKEVTDEIRTNIKTMSFADKEDKKVDFSSLQSSDKPTFVMFWASWCPDCQAQLPIIDKMYKKYKDDVNFVMVNVVDGSREKLGAGQKYFSDKGYDFAYYYDNHLVAADSVSVEYIPTMYILDKEGNIQFAYEVNQSQKQLESNFKSVI